MTTAVPTNGFTAPPGVNIPPPNMEPGFVQNPAGATPPAEPASTPAAAPAPSALDAQVAALLAALQAQQAPAPAAATVVPDSHVQDPTGLNSLDPATLEDPILRSMATVMQTVGKDLDMDRVFSKALDHGDASLIDAAYLREKGGANADQLLVIAQGIVQAVNAQAAAVTAEVHSLAGGSQNWEASVAAFNKNAPVEFRQVVALMLDSKDKGKISAGAKLVVEFSKGSGLIPNAQPLIQAGAGSGAAQALTKEAFQAELRKLNPHSREFSEQRQALFARRQIGRNLGQ